MVRFGQGCYWRFIGDKSYRYGYPSRIDGSRLIRMGLYNGDFTGGYIVDEREIETQ